MDNPHKDDEFIPFFMSFFGIPGGCLGFLNRQHPSTVASRRECRPCIKIHHFFSTLTFGTIFVKRKWIVWTNQHFSGDIRSFSAGIRTWTKRNRFWRMMFDEEHDSWELLNSFCWPFFVWFGVITLFLCDFERELEILSRGSYPQSRRGKCMGVPRSGCFEQGVGMVWGWFPRSIGVKA